MQKIDEKKTKIRRFSSALITKLDTGVLLNRQAFRDQHESLTVSELLSEILQDDLSCSEEAGENYHTGS
jgi:hypothetical protein